MPYVKYTGPHEEVEVPDLNLRVKRNQTIEVPAAALDGLLCQEDVWKKTTATKSAEVAALDEPDPDLTKEA